MVDQRHWVTLNLIIVALKCTFCNSMGFNDDSTFLLQRVFHASFLAAVLLSAAFKMLARLKDHKRRALKKEALQQRQQRALNYFLRNSMQNDLKLRIKEPGCVFLQVLIYCWLHSKDYKKIGSFRDQNADFAALIANGSGIPHTRSVARSFSSTCSAEASDSSVA